eukprot:Amastigsp_a517194_7.p4 type:complete len:101 gc:universal Amastigsp_a517194_7:391-89(-)
MRWSTRRPCARSTRSFVSSRVVWTTSQRFFGAICVISTSSAKRTAGTEPLLRLERALARTPAPLVACRTHDRLERPSCAARARKRPQEAPRSSVRLRKAP